jgi:hypoxanthine phosphoribosyltransferase
MRDSRNIKLPENCRLVFSNQQILEAMDRLAARLDERLAGTSPVALCVMQGGLIFAGHIIPRLNCMLEIDYVHATRYNNETRGSELKWLAHPASSLQDRVVLILDDILDEGHTLHALIEFCKQQGASDVVSAVLLNKNHDRGVEHRLTEYIALDVDDHYVFGFGMDYNGQYRQLDSIYALSDTSEQEDA